MRGGQQSSRRPRQHAACPASFPLARAFRRPARTRSTIKLRSNSATAPKTVKTILPGRRRRVHLFAQTDKRDAESVECFERPQQVS